MVKSPLQYVTDLIAGGSRSELARILEIHRSTVTGWDNPKRRARGMSGTIPDEYIPKIRQFAEVHGIKINLGALYPVFEAQEK